MIKTAPQTEEFTGRFPCWCDADDWRLRVRGRNFRLLQCAHCRTSRIDPPPIQSDIQSEEFYTGYYQQIDARLFSPPPPGRTQTSGFWRVAAKHASLQPLGRRVLDYGCGDGTLCRELHLHGCAEVYGVDVSRTRVERARQKYPEIRFFTRLTPGIDVEAASFDLVILEAVVEHFPAPLAVLEQLGRLLRPEGRIVLTTPNMDSGAYRFLGRRWTGMLAPHAHIFLFGHQCLARLLEATGFRVEQTGSYHAPWYTPLEFTRRLCRGQLKNAVWRAHQEVGNFYGRLVGEGPMLFAIASR